MSNLAGRLVSASRLVSAPARPPIAHSLACRWISARHNSSDAGPSKRDQDAIIREYLQNLDLASVKEINAGGPNLMEPDILMDLHESETFPPSKYSRFENKVVIRNNPSMFVAAREQAAKERGEDLNLAEKQPGPPRTDSPLALLHLSPGEINRLYRYAVLRRRVVQQTGKGRIPQQHVVMVVGNEDGLVGIGEGKASEGSRATQTALVSAVRNMDYVERFEERTVWTEMEVKFASTKVILRPRPVGFGLQCNPNIYHILKAAGIKDISAKVWGSRNPLQVVRAMQKLLMPGYLPLGMGNGFGGKGRRMDKGIGLRPQDEIERERGRKLVSLRL
ncbi:uncharacterized protein LAESUDRAFT_728796 [Laetiporus sulphureus 93-53]|uniref:S5 DRBM domain-containing protein n=1 Tax=Laetiporus sulphureus 93-53 TaxID=1314785 RepID=A0A165CYU7_9APHY|nr:uncharacterized protein LAESUDRAFT_728796 [Laetiporus sulphureus 93-53]KZT03771.1 hypothetical protein LAESUDRAFT_728796 [Laetiporus sulphureus 93-53]